MKGSLFLAAIAFSLAVLTKFASADVVKLTVAIFPSVQNLPLFVAKSKGFYSKRGLDVDIHFVKNSTELRDGLAEGAHQIAHSAIDNVLTLKDKSHAE